MSTWAGECFGVSDRGMTPSVENKRSHGSVLSEQPAYPTQIRTPGRASMSASTRNCCDVRTNHDPSDTRARHAHDPHPCAQQRWRDALAAPSVSRESGWRLTRTAIRMGDSSLAFSDEVPNRQGNERHENGA